MKGSSSTELPYKFNGKELDSETDLYYYGARYMNPITSLWYGVDPLAEKYPNVGAFVYCVGNPINRIDPDGRDDYKLYTNVNLVLTRIDTKSKMDKITYVGEKYDDGNNTMFVNHGILQGEKVGDDISKKSATFRDVKLGMSFMRFISKHCGKELVGWGIKYKSGNKALLVKHWSQNWLIKKANGNLANRSQCNRNILKDGATFLYSVHTHPEVYNHPEFGGHFPSKADVKMKDSYGRRVGKNHYIMLTNEEIPVFYKYGNATLENLNKSDRVSDNFYEGY